MSMKESFESLQDREGKARTFLRELDDARYGWMMRAWVRLADKPKLALGILVGLCSVSFLLGRLG